MSSPAQAFDKYKRTLKPIYNQGGVLSNTLQQMVMRGLHEGWIPYYSGYLYRSALNNEYKTYSEHGDIHQVIPFSIRQSGRVTTMSVNVAGGNPYLPRQRRSGKPGFAEEDAGWLTGAWKTAIENYVNKAINAYDFKIDININL